MLGAQGLQVAVQGGAGGRVVSGHVGEGGLRCRLQERRRAADLRGHDVRSHQAGEQHSRQREQHEQQHHGHDGDEEVGDEELGADAPEEPAHEVAAQPHEGPGAVDEQRDGGEDVEAAGEGHARAVRRVDGDGREQDATGPAPEEEVA